MVQYAAFWLMLAASCLVYWGLPQRWRAGFLGLVSFGFICAFEPFTAVAMLVIGWVVYQITDPAVRNRLGRRSGWAAIAILLVYLGYFKYLPTIGGALTDGYDFSDILLPLGISYFTFKLIHYVVERGRGTLPEHGFDDYLAYIFLVPIFTAGPIQRFDLFIRQRADRWDNTHAWEGLTRIAHGMIKKFVIGAAIFDVIMGITNGGGASALVANIETVNPLRVGAFLVLMYLYVYMDFSAYTDIAIGSSRLFGLRIMENFNLPIFAPNIGNLWKRWHMSLANWCQTYIYMPMIGLTRNPYVAVVSSFTVMGLWHAASLNWLAWGLYNAFGVMVFQFWSQTARRRKWRIVKTRVYAWFGYPLTFLYFSGSFAFTATDQTAGLWGAVQLLAKCLFITLPG